MKNRRLTIRVPWPKLLILGRSLLIGLLLVFAFTGDYVPAQTVIPIVHTWGDLRNAPKLTTVPVHGRDPQKNLPRPTEPVSFQVGLASNETTANGAAVLYFLGETGSENPYTPYEWGTYWLQIDGVAGEGWTYNITYQPGGNHTGTLFYAQAILFTTPGDHIVELIKPFNPDAKPTAKPEVMARATIHVHDDPNSLWYPLWTTQDTSSGAPRGQNADGTRYAVETVRNPQGDSAFPQPPRPRWYTGFPAPNVALPSLFPSDVPGAGVQLKMTDATLVVTFDPKIEGFFPDDYFLTRWWVNGNQVTLDPKAQAPGQMRSLGSLRPNSAVQTVAWHPAEELPFMLIGAQIWYTQEVHFNLDFQPDWIGAKKGDRVDVQFLYCPDSYLRARIPLPDFASESDPVTSVFSQTSFSELSNKLEFIYSGDPTHPQQ